MADAPPDQVHRDPLNRTSGASRTFRCSLRARFSGRPQAGDGPLRNCALRAAPIRRPPRHAAIVKKPVTERPKARLLVRSRQGFHSPSDGRENRPVCLGESVACRVPAHSAVDSKRAVSDRDRMIRASAALYYWFGFPTISAEGRMRVI